MLLAPTMLGNCPGAVLPLWSSSCHQRPFLLGESLVIGHRSSRLIPPKKKGPSVHLPDLAPFLLGQNLKTNMQPEDYHWNRRINEHHLPNRTPVLRYPVFWVLSRVYPLIKWACCTLHFLGGIWKVTFLFFLVLFELVLSVARAFCLCSWQKSAAACEETRRKYDDCGFDEDNITTTEARGRCVFWAGRMGSETRILFQPLQVASVGTGVEDLLFCIL